MRWQLSVCFLAWNKRKWVSIHIKFFFNILSFSISQAKYQQQYGGRGITFTFREIENYNFSPGKNYEFGFFFSLNLIRNFVNYK